MVTFIRFFVLFSVVLLVASSRSPELKGHGDWKSVDSCDVGKREKYIVLLGASIGRGWDISSLPERINNSNYVIEYIHGGSFDKSDRLREIISRLENKPDAIFIKECAAYFAGDLKLYKSLMKQWIKECYEAEVIPIPTTVVPVTRLHSFKKFLIDIVKGRNPFKHGNPFNNRRNNTLLEFNDWIRMYCKKKGLSVLDLEAAVRYSEKNRYLREDFARVDGLHINKKAYKMLDQIVIPTLETVNWENKNDSLKMK